MSRCSAFARWHIRQAASRALVLGLVSVMAAIAAEVVLASPAPARVRGVMTTPMRQVPDARATVRSTMRRAETITFDTPVARGTWPSDGSAPAAYRGMLSYPDGTSDKYFPSKVLSVHHGVLDWWCHDDMAATVVPFGYRGFRFGTYTVRMRTQRFSGYHIAFLLWPATNTWTNEVDGPENETSAARPYPAVLQNTSPVRFAPSHTAYAPRNWHSAFHNYTWVWTPRAISFYQDNRRVATVRTHVPRQRMRPTLQVEFSDKLADGTAPRPSLSGHVYVDRVSYTPRIVPPAR